MKPYPSEAKNLPCGSFCIVNYTSVEGLASIEGIDRVKKNTPAEAGVLIRLVVGGQGV